MNVENIDNTGRRSTRVRRLTATAAAAAENKAEAMKKKFLRKITPKRKKLFIKSMFKKSKNPFETTALMNALNEFKEKSPKKSPSKDIDELLKQFDKMGVKRGGGTRRQPRRRD